MSFIISRNTKLFKQTQDTYGTQHTLISRNNVRIKKGATFEVHKQQKHKMIKANASHPLLNTRSYQEKICR